MPKLFPHIWNNMSEKTKEILAMADCLFSGMKECEVQIMHLFVLSIAEV